MKKITLRMEPLKKGSDYRSFNDYVMDSYPTDQCDVDPDESVEKKMTFVFYAAEEKLVTEWFEPAAPSFGFKVKDKKVEALTAAQYKAIQKRMDG